MYADEGPRFRLRTGSPAWARITCVDVDALLEGSSTHAVLSDLVDDLAFGRVTVAELRKVGLDAAETLVRLLQLAVERAPASPIASRARAHATHTKNRYLLHVQAALGDEADAAKARGAKAQADARKYDSQRRLADERRPASLFLRWFLGATSEGGGGTAPRPRKKFPNHRRRHRSAARQVDEYRDVALALAGAARAAGVDTARWLRALRDDDAAAKDFDLVGAYGRDAASRCAACGKAFVTKEYLRRHCEAAHGGGGGGPVCPPATTPAQTPPAQIAGDGCDVEVGVSVTRCGGLPLAAKAGCVVVLSRGGTRLGATDAALGDTDPRWTGYTATVALPLDARDQNPYDGIDVEVWGGAVLLGVARATAPRLLYDGLVRLKLRADDDSMDAPVAEVAGWVELRCRVAARVVLDRVSLLGKALPAEARLAARWRGQGSLVWESGGRAEALTFVAHARLGAPLPLGLPLLRRHAVLDVEARVQDQVVASVALGAAQLRNSVLEGGRREFAGPDGRCSFAAAACSPLASELARKLAEGESDMAGASSVRPAADLAFLDAYSSDEPFALDTHVRLVAVRNGVDVLASPAVDGGSTDLRFPALTSSVTLADLTIELRRSDGRVLARGGVDAGALSATRLIRCDLKRLDVEAPCYATLKCTAVTKAELRVFDASLLDQDGLLTVRASVDGVLVLESAAASRFHETIDVLIPAEALEREEPLVRIDVYDEEDRLRGSTRLHARTLAKPTRRADYPLVDARGAVVGELGVALAAAAPSGRGDHFADAKHCPLVDVVLEKLSVEGAPADAFEVDVRGATVASVALPGVVKLELPLDARGYVVLKALRDGDVVLEGAVAARELLRGAGDRAPRTLATSGAGIPRQAPSEALAATLAPPGGVPGDARVRFSLKLARRLRLRVCGASGLADGGDLAAALYLAGAVVGETKPKAPDAGAVSWQDCFDVAVTEEAKGAVELRVGAATLALGDVGALAAAPGLRSLPLAALGAGAAAEIHVAVTDFGAAARYASARVDDDRKAMDAAVSLLETPSLAARPDVADAIGLLKGEAGLAEGSVFSSGV